MQCGGFWRSFAVLHRIGYPLHFTLRGMLEPRYGSCTDARDESFYRNCGERMLVRFAINAVHCLTLAFPLVFATASRITVAMVPPPPAHTLPATVPVCQTGSYLVFFGSGSARLSAETRSMLDFIAADARTHGFPRLFLFGGSDRQGDAAMNAALATRRVLAVRAYLTAQGVPDDSMTALTNGEDALIELTEDDVAAHANRRVELMPTWDNCF